MRSITPRFRSLIPLAHDLLRRIDNLRGTEASYGLLIVTVGLLGGLVGVLYQVGIRLCQIIYFASSGTILEIAKSLPWQRCLVAPAGGALLAAIIIKYSMRGAGTEGMAEIMEAVVLKEKLLSVRRSLWKGLSSMIAIATG